MVVSVINMYPDFLIWNPKDCPKAVPVHPLGLKCTPLHCDIFSGICENPESLDLEMPTIFPFIFAECPVGCKARPSICISSRVMVAIQQDIFYWGASLVHMCSPKMTVQQETGTLGQGG